MRGSGDSHALLMGMENGADAVDDSLAVSSQNQTWDDHMRARLSQLVGMLSDGVLS